MLIDARSVPTGTKIDTEVCIVGGGAAGITLAREFANSGFRVALLESGDTAPDLATQKLYSGTNIGRHYFDPKDTRLRLRYFGGSTNHWAGQCALPDPLDFETRNGMEFSGWPFPLSYLKPWYARAQDVCQLGPDGYAPTDWGIAPSDIPEPFNGPHFICQVLQNSPPTVFGRVYGAELAKAPRLTVYLNANALRLEIAESEGDVRQIEVGTLSGNRFNIRAKIHVLATGGIENARLLLLSGKDGGNGIGNEADLVGRFFMVHLDFPGGIIALANPFTDLKFCTDFSGRFFVQSGFARRFTTYVCLSQQSRREMKLPHLRFFLSSPSALTSGETRGDDSIQEMESMMRDLYGFNTSATRNSRENPLGTISVRCTAEQMPDPESRITLGDHTDAFGLRTTTIDWRLTNNNRLGVAAGHRLFGAELGRTGFGRFRSSMANDGGSWPERMRGDEHTMGTTRMHRDRKLGVVDENCRVHGVQNLYVTGSSVFPTGGAANPTLTIVALALRLADHIKGRLA